MSENIEEIAYLNLLKSLLDKPLKNDRTGTGTHSSFGNMLRFSLKDGQLPLLTTKKVYWKGVVEELLFFIRGQTDNKILKDKKVNIWNGNTSKEYLEKNNIKLNEDDLGPIYGFNWRHFGAEYSDCHANYDGQGIDQLNEAINLIKNDPNSRRILVSAWNPLTLKKACLYPCHVSFQFYVDNGELSCLMYQRSVDCFLGLPFNIASYALLTHIIADHCSLKTGELIISMGDTHIYSNHRNQCLEQIARKPFNFPKLNIKNKKTKIEDYQFEDFELIGYESWPTIKANMAV